MCVIQMSQHLFLSGSMNQNQKHRSKALKPAPFPMNFSRQHHYHPHATVIPMCWLLAAAATSLSRPGKGDGRE